ITCECERTQEPSMSQALLFINGDAVNQKVTADGGIVDRLVKAGKTDSEILETLYLTALGRHPANKERANALAALSRAAVVAQPRQSQPATVAQSQTPTPVVAGTPAQTASGANPPAAVHGQLPDINLPRRRALEDLLWVLVNSKEFLFNH